MSGSGANAEKIKAENKENAQEGKKTSQAAMPKSGKSRQLNALRTLLPYLWPKGKLDIRMRVVLALLCLAGAKFANVTVPILFGKSIDALDSPENAILAVPFVLIFGYGLARLMTVVFQECREALFAKVSQQAIRRVALEVFRHLHALSLRFHLERQTGGLSRNIERG
ncbi:MAG: ABC transporter transmembrane domain-containing protein, partial [Alphaproteobacteria bacterium]|nr:ABC transporter transmembrane domain-containing protein [Alphaproteobacteria bacterium]